MIAIIFNHDPLRTEHANTAIRTLREYLVDVRGYHYIRYIKAILTEVIC